MAPDLDARITVPDGVLIRELEGESVLLDLNSASYFGLDDVGTRMWAALTNTGSVREAYDALLAEYAVEPDRLQSDLGDFLGRLSELGLIHVVDR